MRGQGISINVIVLTAIALIVLIVLVVMLTGRVQIFGKGLGTCKGSCVSSVNLCTGSAIPTTNCNDGSSPVLDNGYCCISAT